MTRGMPRDPSRWYESLEAEQEPIVAAPADAPEGPPAAQRAAAEGDGWFTIEIKGPDTEGLYIERGPIEGGVIWFEPMPVRRGPRAWWRRFRSRS